jgi:hypothetical protein
MLQMNLITRKELYGELYGELYEELWGELRGEVYRELYQPLGDQIRTNFSHSKISRV